MLTDSERRQLDEQGYLVLPDLMGADLLQALRSRVEQLFDEEGAAAGSEFKQEPGARRLANLVNKGALFEDVILTPRVLECMAHVLGPKFKLSSVNVRSALPNSDCDQPLHADSGAVADEDRLLVLHSVWILDDFTAERSADGSAPPLAQAAAARHASRIPRSSWCQAPQVGGGVNAHMWRRHRQPPGTPRRAMHVYYTR
jgi:hypothetical protein